MPRSADNLPRPGQRNTLGRLCGLSPSEADRGERMLWLCGDGYRAALFHLGALARLNELGLVAQIGTVAAVSGGSIAAALLATRVRWPFQGTYGDWEERVGGPLRALASEAPARTGAPRRPFPGVAGEAALEERYARELLGSVGAEPSPGPRFVFGASGLALSGITGSWEECLEWEIDSSSGGYGEELVAEVLRPLPSGLEGFGEAERAVLENHGYLLADAATGKRGLALDRAGEAAEIAVPHPQWMDEERVRAVLAAPARRSFPQRLRRWR